MNTNVVWSAVSLLALAACGGADDGVSAESGTAEQDFSESAASDSQPGVTQQSCSERPGSALRLATFNTGLAPNFELYVAERTPKVIRALAAQARQVDALCVQEVWLESDFAKLQSAVAKQLPTVLRHAPRPGTGTCTMDELNTLGQCLGTKCPTATGIEQVACAQAYCVAEVASLSGGCLGCIWNSIGTDFSGCVGAGGEGDPAIYGGSFEVGLLTRLPVLASETSKELDSYFTRAGVLYAKLAAPDGRPVHTFCTHLGSPLDIVPYVGKYASWKDEQLVQIQQLRAYINEKAGPGERVVVMGDLNTGPDGRGMLGDWSDNYVALVGNDLIDPYFEQRHMDCSYCPDNAFVDDASPKKLIDHVLIRGISPAKVHVSRILDQIIQIGSGSEAFTSNLSDHYGLRATIRP
jgi:endonuclease/exonuclease/phosphatase family metal-dependent hydrolase